MFTKFIERIHYSIPESIKIRITISQLKNLFNHGIPSGTLFTHMIVQPVVVNAR